MSSSFKEAQSSLFSALMLLKKLGYSHLTQEEALDLRQGSTSNVLLIPILHHQLEHINIAQNSAQTPSLTSHNITEGIKALENIPLNKSFMSASQTAYDLLTRGKVFEQTVNGSRKNVIMQYIDWKNISNNIFHVTERFPVTRTGSNEIYCPDIVLFVNGIPLCIIECKYTNLYDSLTSAISQHLQYQKEDGIRPLYLYSSLLLSITTQAASYATTATPESSWTKWVEQFANKKEEKAYKQQIYDLVNSKLTDENYFLEHSLQTLIDSVEICNEQQIIPTVQDEYLYSLCRPERLLDLIYRFTLYDDGIKKIAHYHQYFIVCKTMNRIRNIKGGKRRGGLIWQTQGSGKSLTLFFLAQAIMLNENIHNPKIILITDRTVLDQQITSTLKKCGTYVENASTGSQLLKLLESKSHAVITTVIHKFIIAIKSIKEPFTNPNIFVLIDEGHRSQYGVMGMIVAKTLPNACFITMIGTPLLKEDVFLTNRFDGIIQPVYTINQAIRDGRMTPLLYERRNFSQITHEQSDQTNQRIYAIAKDISSHYKENWQGTKFKAQLIVARKYLAILYKKFLDEIGIVSSEVLIGTPNIYEGEETAHSEASKIELIFWEQMIEKYGTVQKYETSIINKFKNSEKPEIIIVVDKLLSGFDEPKNAILYIDRDLKGHTLLQAIARINRVCDDKEFGYIIDYYGIQDNINSALEKDIDADAKNLKNIFTDIFDEIGQLPQKHSEVWSIFKEISNNTNPLAYEELLRTDSTRYEFYKRLTAFTSILRMALSTNDYQKKISEEEIQNYKKDLLIFLKIKDIVQKRYLDTINKTQYESQIQKFIDTHIKEENSTKLTGISNKINFTKESAKDTNLIVKTDTTVPQISNYIVENKDANSILWNRFLLSLKETISTYQQTRIDKVDFLKLVTECMNNTNNEIPVSIQKNYIARIYFELSLELYKMVSKDKVNINLKMLALNTAKTIDSIIRNHITDKDIIIVDWPNKGNIIGKIKIEIEDYITDEIKYKHNIPVTFDDIDWIVDQYIEVAKLWFKECDTTTLHS